MADPTRNDAREPPAFHSERELIVLSRTGGVSRRAAPAPASPQELTGLLQSYGARMTPVFEVSPRTAVARTPRAAARAGARAPVAQLPNYYAVQVADDRKDELAEQLRNHPLVEAAFVKPAPEPPVRPPAAGGPSSRPMPPVPAASPTIADFTSRQGYLEKAPEGIDARRAWKRPGGRGADVNVIDIEGEWNFAHDDLIVNQGGMIGGSSANDLGWRNHGTAVAGEISADVNGFGCTGISPEAHIRAISVFGPSSGTAGAIRQAADALSPGDILLIELHFPGPRFNFAPRADQLGYIAAEWWPDNFAAITYATAVRGVIAKVNAAVVLPVLVDHELELELEVLERVGRRQRASAPRVAVLRADDHPGPPLLVLDPPDGRATRLPARQVLAVKQRPPAVVRVGGGPGGR